MIKAILEITNRLKTYNIILDLSIIFNFIYNDLVKRVKLLRVKKKDLYDILIVDIYLL